MFNVGFSEIWPNFEISLKYSKKSKKKNSAQIVVLCHILAIQADKNGYVHSYEKCMYLSDIPNYVV